MVTAEFHDFFLGAASVAGALIGLLFVAISIDPGGVRESGNPQLRLRPAAALSALLNAMLVSLLALIPELAFAVGVRAVAVSGLATMITLLVLLIDEARRSGRKTVLRPATATLVQSVVYVAQLVAALHIDPEIPARVGALDGQALLVIILFVLGINRAWQYVGADTPALIPALARVVGNRSRRRPNTPPSSEGD